ncbi:MAG: DUF2147 domain-containing protein [Halioglobus sp.]
MKPLLCVVGVSISLLLLISIPAKAVEKNDLAGHWVLPDGSAIVHIEASPEGLLEGRVIGLLRPQFSVVDNYGKIGEPRLDLKNSKKSARDRPILGMEITSELRFEDNIWKGKIYDPRSGSSYRCVINLEGEEFARVRGYIGFSMIGRTMHWQRLESFRSQMFEMLGDKNSTRPIKN